MRRFLGGPEGSRKMIRRKTRKPRKDSIPASRFSVADPKGAGLFKQQLRAVVDPPRPDGSRFLKKGLNHPAVVA